MTTVLLAASKRVVRYHVEAEGRVKQHSAALSNHRDPVPALPSQASRSSSLQTRLLTLPLQEYPKVLTVLSHFRLSILRTLSLPNLIGLARILRVQQSCQLLTHHLHYVDRWLLLLEDLLQLGGDGVETLAVFDASGEVGQWVLASNPGNEFVSFGEEVGVGFAWGVAHLEEGPNFVWC